MKDSGDPRTDAVPQALMARAAQGRGIMAFRKYITIDGSEQKVYEGEFSAVQGEYSCDSCHEVIERGSPQVHLTVDGILLHFGNNPEDKHRLPSMQVDYHSPECVGSCGTNILHALFDGPLPLIGSREPYVPC